jgi:hypothetical protein
MESIEHPCSTEAIGAIYVSARTAKRTEQASATANAIAEFFSDGFPRHRVSVHRTRQKYLQGEVQISEIAAGFWYPGRWPGPTCSPAHQEAAGDGSHPAAATARAAATTAGAPAAPGRLRQTTEHARRQGWAVVEVAEDLDVSASVVPPFDRGSGPSAAVRRGPRQALYWVSDGAEELGYAVAGPIARGRPRLRDVLDGGLDGLTMYMSAAALATTLCSNVRSSLAPKGMRHEPVNLGAGCTRPQQPPRFLPRELMRSRCHLSVRRWPFIRLPRRKWTWETAVRRAQGSSRRRSIDPIVSMAEGLLSPKGERRRPQTRN